MLDEAEADDRFGTTLATGDFNKDGRDDLVVGVPYENIGTTVDAGAVHVIYGSSTGLVATGNEFWHQGDGLQGTPEALDYFGYALAAGDFDGDDYVDLAIGAPLETLEGTPSVASAGVVHVLYGYASGLSTDFDQLWQQDYLSTSESEDGDNFGKALAAGDFNGDGRCDLAVGTPGEGILSSVNIASAGAVNIIYGSGSGLTGTGTQVWHQNYAAIDDLPEPFDYFGWSLAAADFNGDGQHDLAIGVPYENAGDGTLDTGLVHVLYGHPTQGLSTTGNQIWEPISPEEGDRFGFALAAIWPRLVTYQVYLPLTLQASPP